MRIEFRSVLYAISVQRDFYRRRLQAVLMLSIQSIVQGTSLELIRDGLWKITIGGFLRPLLLVDLFALWPSRGHLDQARIVSRPTSVLSLINVQKS